MLTLVLVSVKQQYHNSDMHELYRTFSFVKVLGSVTTSAFTTCVDFALPFSLVGRNPVPGVIPHLGRDPGVGVRQ